MSDELGFYRRWDGHMVYLKEFHHAEQKVVWVDFENKEHTSTEEHFFGKEEVGPIGDMITGWEEPEYVPRHKKVIGWQWIRHSGHNTLVTPKLKK